VPLPPVPVSQTPEEKFREYLTSRPEPKRYTEQMRQLVRHVFAKHSHFDADQLMDELKSLDHAISRATVYRTLAKLVDAGMLRTIEIGPRTIYDHDYGYPWHEHLVCESCAKIIEVQLPAIESLLQGVAGEHRFRIQGHMMVARGECHECASSNADRVRRVM
jgi:Fur family transcriptional regulator, ferric uptake regulator